jgi:hypothetical protein
VREWHAKDIYWADPEAAANVLRGNNLTPRLTYNTAREVLTRCITAISSRYFEALPGAQKSSISLSCRSIANVNLNHSEGHLFLALFSHDMQDGEAALYHLEKSRILAPRDQFNIEWRLILAHRIRQWSNETISNYSCANDLQIVEAYLPDSKTLNFLRDAGSPMLKECAA